ncbi:MAG: hypothetical protein ACLUFN_08930 [Eubacterium sp.]
MKELARQYECWMDEKEKILSFHYVSEYIHKCFKTYKDFFSYVIWNSQNGFKIQ